MLAFQYIAYHYIKYFLIILTALTCFIVGWNYMFDPQPLSNSANLILIYLVYKVFFAIDMLLPLSLIFAMISTKVFLIRSNALVSFYSLGYSKTDILRPFVIISTLIIVLFIHLHSYQNFSRANEFAKNIRINGEYLSSTRDLFFTYKNQYIYFSKLIPIQSKAEGIRVFSMQNDTLKEVLVASSALYKNSHWHIQEANIIIKPDKLTLDSLGIEIKNSKDLEILHNFKPKILDQVYDGKVNFTIGDALDAFVLLKDQNVNTDTIKGSLYKIFVYPFFVPFLLVIIFFFVPVSSRSLNVSLFSFSAILATLIIWAILFSLIQLSNSQTISSELGIVLPIIILFLIAIRQWRRYRLST